MDNRAVVDRIMKNLAFDLETVPKTKTGGNNTTSSSKTDPLNLKIRVRKKEIANEPQNQGFISNNQSEPEMVLQKVRLVNSDETIMSFDMFMEAEFDKKTTPKSRKHIFDKLKPGLCLGAADDDDHPYLPDGNKVIESNSASKSNEVLKQPFQLVKNTHENFGDSIGNRRDRNFLGRKCKPGGCLDPPFDEDSYAYKPSTKEPLKHESKDKEPSKAMKEIPINTKPDIKTPESSKRKSKDSSIKSVVKSKVKESRSILSIYRAESPRNSLITYPPDEVTGIPKTKISIEGDETKRHRKRASSEDKSRQSVNESMNSFFSLPKGVIRDSNISVGRDQSKRNTYSPKSIRNKPVEYVKAPISISVSLVSVPLEQNDVETVNDTKLIRDRSLTKMKSDSKDDELNAIAPFILPLPISVSFSFDSKNADAQISSSKTENVDSEITAAKKSSKSPSPYSSCDAIPKLDSKSNAKEIKLIENSLDITSIDVIGKDLKSRSREESPAIEKKIISKYNSQVSKNGISKMDTTTDRKEHLLKPQVQNGTNLKPNDSYQRKSTESETHKIDNVPTIQRPRKELTEIIKPINDQALKVPATVATAAAIATAALATTATIKHTESRSTKPTEENENKSTENELPVSIKYNQKENLTKNTDLSTLKNTTLVDTTLKQESVSAKADNIIKTIKTLQKSPSLESKNPSNKEISMLLGKEFQNSSNILNKNHQIQDQLNDWNDENLFKEKNNFEQQIKAIKDFKNADNFPIDLVLEHKKETDIKSVERSDEELNIKAEIDKENMSQTLIGNHETVPVSTYEHNFLPLALNSDGKITSNKHTISPVRGFMLDERKTSLNESVVEDKAKSLPETSHSIRASLDRITSNKIKNSPTRGFSDKNIASPLSKKKNVSDRRYSDIKKNPDRDSLDKEIISPDKESLDKGRISLDKDSLDKRRLLPDNSSNKKTLPDKDSLDKRRFAPGTDFLEKKTTLPDSDTLDKRIISPHNTSDQRTLPDKDYLDKRRSSPIKDFLEKKTTSPDKNSLDRRKIQLNQYFIDKRRTQPDKDSVKPHRIASPGTDTTKTIRSMSPDSTSSDKKRIPPHRGSSDKKIVSPNGGLLDKKHISSLDKKTALSYREHLDKKRVSPDRTSSKNNSKLSPDRVTTRDNRISPDRLSELKRKKQLSNFKEKLLTSPDVFSANDSSMVSIDLAFHSYINNRNERILSTVDVRNQITRYPNDSIILIKSQVKLNSIENNEFNIPIDSELDMAIEIKKTDDNNKIFYKKEPKPTSETVKVEVAEINHSNTERTKDVIQKVQPRTKDNEKMCSTLTDIYEHQLVPLQTMIRDLKQEIDALTALQYSFKKKVTCQKKNKVRITHSNKNM